MRKFYAFLSILLLSSTLQATDLYWIGGSGDWEDPNHWSDRSNGQSSLQIPGTGDRVIIDENSLSAGDYIQFQNAIDVRSIEITNLTGFSIRSLNNAPISIENTWEIEKGALVELDLGATLIQSSERPEFENAASVSGGFILEDNQVQIGRASCRERVLLIV